MAHYTNVLKFSNAANAHVLHVALDMLKTLGIRNDFVSLQSDKSCSVDTVQIHATFLICHNTI